MCKCRLLDTCPFFAEKLEDVDGIYVIYVNKYCLGKFSDCARFVVAEKYGREHVPFNLYPSQQQRAKVLVQNQL